MSRTERCRSQGPRRRRRRSSGWTEHRRILEDELRELKAYLEEPDATEREEAVEEIAKTLRRLEIIRIALSGLRPVLRLLKGVSDKLISETGSL